MSIKRIVSIALMTAVICVLSPFAITIPITPVPISLATLAIYLALIILGHYDGTISVIAYVSLGLVGVPVFTGFVGGVGKVFGPTGGYIIGYIFLAFVAGFFINGSRQNYLEKLFGMLLGTAVLYIFGSLWLARQVSMSLAEAFLVGGAPFIIGDVVKILVALFVGTHIRKTLVKNNLI